MSTLAELNSYSQNSVQFTSNLTVTVQENNIITIPLITFDLAKTLGPLDTSTLTVTTVFDLTGSPGGITNIGAIMTLANVSATSSNIVITTNATTITITNIITAEDYLAGSVGIQMPFDFPTDFVLNCVTTISNTRTYIINTTINVVDMPELLPLVLDPIRYLPNATTFFSTSQYPQIVDRDNPDTLYTLTITTDSPATGNYRVELDTLAPTYPLTTNTWAEVSGVGKLTLVGLRDNINGHLRTIRIISGNDANSNGFFSWTLTNPSGFQTHIEQQYGGVYIPFWECSLDSGPITPSTITRFIHSEILRDGGTTASNPVSIKAIGRTLFTQDYIDVGLPCTVTYTKQKLNSNNNSWDTDWAWALSGSGTGNSTYVSNMTRSDTADAIEYMPLPGAFANYQGGARPADSWIVPNYGEPFTMHGVAATNAGDYAYLTVADTFPPIVPPSTAAVIADYGMMYVTDNIESTGGIAVGGGAGYTEPTFIPTPLTSTGNYGSISSRSAGTGLSSTTAGAPNFVTNLTVAGPGSNYSAYNKRRLEITRVDLYHGAYWSTNDINVMYGNWNGINIQFTGGDLSRTAFSAYPTGSPTNPYPNKTFNLAPATNNNNQINARATNGFTLDRIYESDPSVNYVNSQTFNSALNLWHQPMYNNGYPYSDSVQRFGILTLTGTVPDNPYSWIKIREDEYLPNEIWTIKVPIIYMARTSLGQ